MSKSLLTGPLPEDVGAQCAVTVARGYLKTWTEERARSVSDVLYGRIDAWKEDKGIRGINWAHLDEVNFLCAIYADDRSTSLWEEISLAEAISLIALKEAPNRPHVATKGGSVLALYARNISLEVFDKYGSSLLNSIQDKSSAGKRSGEVRKENKERDLNRAAWAFVLLSCEDLIKNYRLGDIAARAGMELKRLRHLRLHNIQARAQEFRKEGPSRLTDLAARARRELENLRK